MKTAQFVQNKESKMKLKFKTEKSIEQFLHLNPTLFLTDETGDAYFIDVDTNMLMYCHRNDIHSMFDLSEPLNNAIRVLLGEGAFKFAIYTHKEHIKLDEITVKLDSDLAVKLTSWNYKKTFQHLGDDLYHIKKGKLSIDM
jgi:hypothetical protein